MKLVCEFKNPIHYGEYLRYGIVLDIEALLKSFKDMLENKNYLEDRYLNFLKNGTECVRCGKKALVAYHETNGSRKKHYNLYADVLGTKSAMLTLDHIVPVSKGGPSELSNYQCLCSACNAKKGNTI